MRITLGNISSINIGAPVTTTQRQEILDYVSVIDSKPESLDTATVVKVATIASKNVGLTI
jgi:hypothetical protein